MLPNRVTLRTFFLTNQYIFRTLDPTCFCILKKTRNRSHSTSVGEIQGEEQEFQERITITNQYEHLSRVMTPLWQIPYEDQLKQKYDWTRRVVHMIERNLKSISKGKRVPSVSPKISRVMPSPITTAYRNKDEFNIRSGVDGNTKTVGFFIGSTASSNVVCVPGTHLVNIKQKHKELAERFQEYVRMSELPACVDFGPGGGNWRGLIVRSNEAGHVLAVAVCHPQSLPSERLLEEQERLKEFFTSGPGKDSCPTSLYFQACPHTRCTHEKAPFMLLHGDPYITEQLLGKTFRISPDSFFQVNTPAAEVLYKTILEKSGLKPMTTLLDICCGTGTISILASDLVRGCVGIESIKGAVLDAKFNARSNNVTNVDFFWGLAEKKIGQILRELDLATDIVALVNPGRAGLDSKVLQKLNECPQITGVVYISCKADMPSTLRNFVQLHMQGKFTLKYIIPVDLFPHTMHTELIMRFQR